MTWVVMKVGWVLQVLLGTTAAESMNAAANIFLGQVILSCTYSNNYNWDNNSSQAYKLHVIDAYRPRHPSS